MMNSDNDSSESASDDGMNWGNPNDILSRFPEPFRGQENENIFDFIKKVEEAFHYNRLTASSKIDILQRLMKDDAEYAVCETKSLDENFEYLKQMFGNPRAIWKKEKETFLEMSQKEQANWTDHFSLKRRIMLIKVSGFIKRAEKLAKEFELLKGAIFSDSTVNSIYRILPQNIRCKMIKKIRKTKERDNRDFLKSVEILNIIQEVLEDEIKDEIEASKYYCVVDENATCGEEMLDFATDSEDRRGNIRQQRY